MGSKGADARTAYPQYYAEVCSDVERILAGPIAADSLAAYVYGLFRRDGTPVSVGATAAAGAAVLDALFKHRAAQVDAEREALHVLDAKGGGDWRALAQITDRAGLVGRDETVPAVLADLCAVAADVAARYDLLVPLAWAVLDAEDRVLCQHAERAVAALCLKAAPSDSSATRVAPLVVDERPDRGAFKATAWALVGHRAPEPLPLVRLAYYDADVLGERHGGDLLPLRVADLDEVPASSPCPDCTAGVVRVPGISGATFDCASCDGTGSVLPPGTRVP